ncbi:MAG: hypothetical protein E3K32_07530 [wastewater metagenome]|nr:hypothetical protein [Candidatus Loosdrechtia aerotolerans]
MIKAANVTISFLVFLFVGFLFGLVITLDSYSPSYLSLRSFGINIPYGFSSLILVFFVITFIAVFFIKKMTAWNMRECFIIIYLITLQTIAFSPSKLDLSDLTIVIFFLIFLIKTSLEKKVIKVTVLDILNLCFFTLLFLTTINGRISSCFSILTFLLIMPLSFLIVNSCSDKEMLTYAIKWFIIITAFSALVAIIQELIFIMTGIPLVGFIERKELRHMFEVTPMGDLLRVPALLGTYVFLAFFLNTGIIFCLCVLLYWSLSRRLKIVISFLIGIMFIALILTFSRYVQLVLVVSIPFILLVRWPRYSLHFASLLIVCALILYLSGYYKDFFDIVLQEIKWGEFRIRLQLNKEGILGILKHPWIGKGIGKSHIYTSYFFGWGAHNNFIRVAGDAGLLGLAVYLLIISYSFIKIIILNFKVSDPEDVGIVRGLLFSISVLLISMQFDSVYMGILLWILMSFIQAAGSVYTRREITTPTIVNAVE